MASALTETPDEKLNRGREAVGCTRLLIMVNATVERSGFRAAFQFARKELVSCVHRGGIGRRRLSRRLSPVLLLDVEKVQYFVYGRLCRVAGCNHLAVFGDDVANPEWVWLAVIAMSPPVELCKFNNLLLLHRNIVIKLENAVGNCAKDREASACEVKIRGAEVDEVRYLAVIPLVSLPSSMSDAPKPWHVSPIRSS
jgi:hypothetical protein